MPDRYAVINTSDNPIVFLNEFFIWKYSDKNEADAAAEHLNKTRSKTSTRIYKVVELPYTLKRKVKKYDECDE